ncbi:MAG TPA: hypothetical protein VFB66_20115 [Tepidisphaeraceae bacterium]|nr:hypothetical protein [Tepidisphaeraceae bacterium]
MDHVPPSSSVVPAGTVMSRSSTWPVPSRRRLLPASVTATSPTLPARPATVRRPPPTARSVPSLRNVPPLIVIVAPATSARTTPRLTTADAAPPLENVPLRPRTVMPGLRVRVPPVALVRLAEPVAAASTISPVPETACAAP